MYRISMCFFVLNFLVLSIAQAQLPSEYQTELDSLYKDVKTAPLGKLDVYVQDDGVGHFFNKRKKKEFSLEGSFGYHLEKRGKKSVVVLDLFFCEVATPRFVNEKEGTRALCVSDILIDGRAQETYFSAYDFPTSKELEFDKKSWNPVKLELEMINSGKVKRMIAKARREIQRSLVKYGKHLSE
jgi:hypothetical protein